jgi:Holliday junction resolvase RusA-like endonuclease
MTETLFVCVPGDPVGKGRPRVRMMGGAGKKPVPMLYTPKETVEYEQRVAHEAAMSMRGAELFAGPVEMKLQIFMPIPASYTKAKKAAARLGKLVPTKKPDLDNILKAICDAFNGVVWIDDTQVVDCHVTKRFGDNPCVMVQVTALEDLQGLQEDLAKEEDAPASLFDWP